MTDATAIRRTRHPRQCPRCDYPLTGIEFDGSEIDHCHRCGGTLVEPGNVKTHYGEWAKPEHWLDSLGRQTTGEKLRCPADGGRMHGFQVPFEDRSVVVDHCETCGALWLDKGEGRKLARIVRAANLRGAESQAARTTERNAAIADNLAAAQETAGKPGVRTYLFQLLTGMPVEVWNPVRSSAMATKTLVGGLVAVYALQLYFFIGASEASAERFIDLFALTPELVLGGSAVWGVFTYMFLHGGPFHLFANAYSLWIFGDNVEDRVGTNRFVALYFLAGLGAAVLQIALQGNPSTPVVGASGAIAGLMGAYMVLFPRVKLWLVIFFIHVKVPVWAYFGLWFVLQLMMGYTQAAGTAWFAHIGGFVVGLAAGFTWRKLPHPLTRRERRVVGQVT